jgi:hypothetical protein
MKHIIDIRRTFKPQNQNATRALHLQRLGNEHYIDTFAFL